MPDRTAENAGNGNSQRRLKTDGAGQHGGGGSPGHRLLGGVEECEPGESTVSSQTEDNFSGMTLLLLRGSRRLTHLTEVTDTLLSWGILKEVSHLSAPPS